MISQHLRWNDRSRNTQQLDFPLLHPPLEQFLYHPPERYPTLIIITLHLIRFRYRRDWGRFFSQVFHHSSNSFCSCTEHTCEHHHYRKGSRTRSGRREVCSSKCTRWISVKSWRRGSWYTVRVRRVFIRTENSQPYGHIIANPLLLHDSCLKCFW